MNAKWLCIFKPTSWVEAYSRLEVEACAPGADEQAILGLEYGQSHIDEANNIWVRIA